MRLCLRAHFVMFIRILVFRLRFMLASLEYSPPLYEQFLKIFLVLVNIMIPILILLTYLETVRKQLPYEKQNEISWRFVLGIPSQKLVHCLRLIDSSIFFCCFTRLFGLRPPFWACMNCL